MVWTALEAAEQLAQEGASVEVIDLRTLRAARPRDRVREREEDFEGAAAARRHAHRRHWPANWRSSITESVFEYLDGPIVRVTAPDTPVPYSPPLEEAFLPNVAKVVEKARWLWKY